jgi:hypothetical protein
MRKRSNKQWISMAALAASLCMAQLPAAQAAECKGMSDKKCNAADSCSWVKTYTTKAGKTVQGYCRNKSAAKKKSTSSAKDSKASSTSVKDAKGASSKSKDAKKSTSKDKGSTSKAKDSKKSDKK